MPALCPHGHGERGGRGGGGGWSTKCGQAGTGEEDGGPKIPKFVRTSFMDDPLQFHRNL